MDVPVSVFAYRQAKEFGRGGKIKLFWKAAGYHVNFYSETWRGGHACCVSDHVLNDCVEWMVARLQWRNKAQAHGDDVVVFFIHMVLVDFI